MTRCGKVPIDLSLYRIALSHLVTIGSVLISVYMALSRQWAADTAQLCGR